MRILNDKFQTTQEKSGFTLIELLIAVGLFSIFSAIAVGGFVQVLRTQGYATAQIAAVSNVNLALEQMAREVRTGYSFSCQNPSTCLDSSDLLFTNSYGQSIIYTMSEGAVKRSQDGGVTYQSLTGKNVIVSRLFFQLPIGVLPNDGYPPRVVIRIEVQPVGGISAPIDIQTTISARTLDG